MTMLKGIDSLNPILATSEKWSVAINTGLGYEPAKILNKPYVKTDGYGQAMGIFCGDVSQLGVANPIQVNVKKKGHFVCHYNGIKMSWRPVREDHTS